MMYSDDELLALSGIQHFAFCRRQWALIHIDQQWGENLLTVQGDLMHDRAHNEAIRERRGDLLPVRGLTVRSAELGLIGKCDVVEFRLDATGHPLPGEDGLWRAMPVEYKRGKSKLGDEDRLQLCAQAMCLEDMFCSDIDHGFLFYGATRSRERVDLDEELRGQVRTVVEERHRLYRRRQVPKVRKRAYCRSCSLVETCVPQLASRSAHTYLNDMLGGA